MQADSAKLTTANAVLRQNLNPDILMMKATEHWHRDDASDAVRNSEVGRVFVQR